MTCVPSRCAAPHRAPGGLVGRHDDRSPVAVDDHLVAGVHASADVGEPEDRGDLACAGKDGGVRRLAAGVCGDPEDELPVQPKGVGRHEVVRDEHGRLADVGETRAGRVQEVIEDPVARIREFDGPFPKVLVVGLGELGAHLLDDLEEDPLHVPASRGEGLLHVLLQLRIVEHEELRLEEGSVPTGNELPDLRGRLFHRGDESPVFGFDLRAGNVVTGDGDPVVQEQERLPARDSGGSTYSRELHHAA